jgi:tape measure domain-containing protein
VSVVANVAINVDSRNAVSKLRQVQQGAQATSQAVGKLNATTAATNDKFKIAANGIKYFTDAAGRARAENGRFLTSTERAAAGIEAQGRAAQQASGKFNGLRNALASLGAGLAVRKAFVDASELESAQARIGLLTKNFSQLTGIQEVAANAAKKFNLSQAESLGTLTDLGNRIGPTGASLQDVANVYEGFNTLLALNKVNSQNAASATLQLNQALGSGRLAGEEFNAISEATPQLLDAVAAVMGRTRSELKQLASDGKISSQVLIEALTRIRTEGAEDLETAFAGAFGATRRFNAALEDFSATIGTELLPALTPLISGATEILKLFGQLPGPVRTLIAAVAGLTAAFVVLAPAISTAIGLLGGLSLATLAAAGPWIALAAGIGVAVAALASYRSEAEKVGGAARGGGAAEVTAASKLLAQKDAQIAGLQGQRQTASGRQRGSIDRNLAVLRRERAQLQSDVKAGTAATPAATAGNAMGTPVGATVGGATSGGRKAGGGADKAASDAKRAAEAAKQEAERVQEVIRNRLAEGQIIAVKIQQQDRIAAAEAAGDKMLVARLKSAEQELDIQYRYAQELAKESNLDAQKAIVYKGLNELTANQLNLQRELDALQAQSDQDRLTSLQKYIEKQYELNKSVQNQLRLSDGVANTLGEGLGSAFSALISGAQGWEQSLQQIASGVLIDIANQLIRIFVIEQAINAIKTLLTPFSAATPLGAGGGQVGKFGTLGPNYGIPQRAKGGPVSSGQTYMVGERGPELFVPGRSGTIVANDKMGGGNTNVVVNVDAKGSSVEGDEQGANQLGRVISAAVQSELIKQQRPGGILAR